MSWTGCALRVSRRSLSTSIIFPDAIEAHLAAKANGLEVTISDERELLLETGGGMVQAEPLIDADPFLVVNSDNLWVDGPADTLSCSRRIGTTRGWMRCCCWFRTRARKTIAAWATSTWTGRDAFAAATVSRVAPFVYHRHSDGLEGAAEGRAGGAFLDQYFVGPGDRRRAVALAPFTKACGSTSERPKPFGETEAFLENV